MRSPACAHCQRPLLALDVDAHVARGDVVFCCAGCASARAVVERLGLQRFDTLGGAPGPVAHVDVDEAGTRALSSALSSARASALSSARSSALSSARSSAPSSAPSSGIARGRALGEGPATRLCVDVDGVSCASCAWLVQKVAAGVDGVAGATLNPARGQLELVVDERFAPPALAVALAAIGHRVTPSRAPKDNGVVDELVVRFGVSAAAAMAAMISSFALFFGLDVDSSYGRLFSALAALGALVAVFFGGVPFLRGAWRSLARGAPTMDLPIALGMLAAFASCLLAAREGNVVSFDTVAVFVTLMLLGRLLERRLVERHRALLLASDDDVAGLEVRRVVAGAPHDVVAPCAVRDVVAGDRLQLARGELCPVDGVVDAGVAGVVDGVVPGVDMTAHADDRGARRFSLAWLTGESEPRSVAVGAAVPAGAHVVDARGAVVVATGPFSATRLAALLATSTTDDDDRSAASGLFPWLAKAWVAGVFVVAVTGAALWWHAGAARLLDVVSALLVVTCPCAFGIAAPLAIERALVLLRARGVFVKSARLWWRAAPVAHAVFDKTGTLTLEEPTLDAPSTALLAGWPAGARAALLAVVSSSNHGRSRALARSLAQSLHRDGSTARAVVVEVREEPGVGLRGRVRLTDGDGVDVVVERDVEDAGATAVRVGDRALTVRFTETLRPGVARELSRLRGLGVQVWVATGDDEPKARALAARLGVDADHVRARCTPEDKAALVRALGGARVMAVGDGVNDAAMFAAAAVCGVPALDRAHLPARADFLLLGTRASGSFGSVVDVVVVARRVRAVLRALLGVATLYNVLVVGAGLLGLLTPLLVAVLMPALSLSLLAAALLLVRVPAQRAAPFTTTSTTTSLSTTTTSSSSPAFAAPAPEVPA